MGTGPDTNDSETLAGDDDVCWFEELEKYKTTDSKSARENYLTTALVWTLSDCPAAKERFLRLMFPEDFFGAFTEVRIKTQVRIEHTGKAGCGYLDIFIDSDQGLAAIECKVDQEPDEEQVRQYEADLAQLAGSKKRVVLSYLSPDKPGFSVSGKSVRWSEVYALLSDPSISTSIMRDFLEFMRRLGMAPFGPVTEETASILPRFQSHLERAINLVQAMTEKIRKDKRNTDLELGGQEGRRTTWYFVRTFACRQLPGVWIQPGLVWRGGKDICLVVYISGETAVEKLSCEDGWDGDYGWCAGITYHVPVEEVQAGFYKILDSDIQSELLAEHVNRILDFALKRLGARE